MNNNSSRIFLSILTLVIGTSLLLINPIHSAPLNEVYLIELDDDSINPVTSEYITESIDRAYQDGAQCLIIRLDTPGGLLNSTRAIVKKMLTSKVPI